MRSFNSLLDNKIMPMAGKLANQKHLSSVRDGIILVLPLIIIGSVFLILTNLPIPGYENFMSSLFGENWATYLQYPVDATFNIIALIAAFGIAYRLAERYEVDPLAAGAISLAAFLLATPSQEGNIPINLIGAEGLFVALIIAMVSTEIYRFFVQRSLTIRMPDGVPPAVAKSFTALVPGFIVIFLIWMARILIEQTGFGDLHQLIYGTVGAPLLLAGSSYIGTMLAVLIQQLLWSIGIHGFNTVQGPMAPVWFGNQGENQQAFAAGEDIPHVVTYEFVSHFVNIGGSGATFGLVFMMLLFAKSTHMKQLGRLSSGPAMFGVNEPVIFGLPIVLNPLMIVPFVLTPLVMTTTTYFAMATGLVAKPAGIAMPFTMPPVISGYLATGGQISGAVIQIINIFIGAAIYFWFFKMIDRSMLRQQTEEQHTVSNDEQEEKSS